MTLKLTNRDKKRLAYQIARKTTMSQEEALEYVEKYGEYALRMLGEEGSLKVEGHGKVLLDINSLKQGMSKQSKKIMESGGDK